MEINMSHHMMGESIFGNEGTALHKAVREAVGANTHISHSGVVGKNDCWLVYQFTSKTDFDKLKDENDTEGVTECKVVTTSIVHLIDKHFRSVSSLSQAYMLISDLMGKGFNAELMRRLSKEGRELERNGDNVKVEIDSSKMSKDLLECLLIKKQLEEE